MNFKFILFLSFWVSIAFAFDFNEEYINGTNCSYLHYSLKNDSIIAARDCNKKQPPASLLKLITTAYLVENKDAIRINPTRFYLDGMKVNFNDFYGDLIIKVNGDPTLGILDSLYSESISNALDSIVKKKIKKIKGNIVIDASGFPKPFFYSPRNDQFMFYQAPAAAAVYHLNNMKLRIVRDSNRVRYRFGPFKICEISPRIKFKRSVKKPRLVWNFKNGLDTLSIKGFLPDNCFFYQFEMGIPDPERYLGEIIRFYLQSYHIEHQGKIIVTREPYEGFSPEKILSIIPPSLKDIIRYGNTASSNLVFEQLFFINSLTNKDLMEYLKRRDVFDDESAIDDVCGLSGKTRLSLNQYKKLFRYLYKNKEIWDRWLDLIPTEKKLNLFQDPYLDSFKIKTGIIPGTCGIFLYDSRQEEFYVFIVHPTDETMSYPIFETIAQEVKKSRLRRRIYP